MTAEVFHRARSWDIAADARVLRVTWDDGTASEYGWEELRRACPCAYCAGEGGFAGNVNASTTFSDTQITLKEVYPVGRYGISPEWLDGHDSGIFTFKILRRAAGLA